MNGRSGYQRGKELSSRQSKLQTILFTENLTYILTILSQQDQLRFDAWSVHTPFSHDGSHHKLETTTFPVVWMSFQTVVAISRLAPRSVFGDLARPAVALAEGIVVRSTSLL
jgi:hypothetical protein